MPLAYLHRCHPGQLDPVVAEIPTYVREKGPPRAFIEKHSADTSVSKSGLTGSRRRRILKTRGGEAGRLIGFQW